MTPETYAQFGVAGLALLVVWKIIAELLPKALAPLLAALDKLGEKFDRQGDLMREVVASNAVVSERIARLEARLIAGRDFDMEPTPVETPLDNPRQPPKRAGVPIGAYAIHKARDG